MPITQLGFDQACVNVFVILFFAECFYGSFLKCWGCILWAGHMEKRPLLLQEKCQVVHSVGCARVQPCTVSLWKSVQTPSAWRAAVPNIAVCTGATWSLIPALIPLDFMVSCHFQRRLLMDT